MDTSSRRRHRSAQKQQGVKQLDDICNNNNKTDQNVVGCNRCGCALERNPCALRTDRFVELVDEDNVLHVRDTISDAQLSERRHETVYLTLHIKSMCTLLPL
jgi:hypothetical protein